MSNERHKLWNALWASLPQQGVPEQQTPKSRSRKGGGRYQPRNTTNSKLSGTTWISGVLLGLWDNVFGPRTEHVWHGVEPCAAELLSDITKDTLAGTMDGDVFAPTFVVLPHASIIVCAVVFTSPTADGMAKHTLALFCQKTHLTRVTQIYSTIEDKLVLLALSFRSLFERGPLAALDRLNYGVARAVASLEAVFKAGNDFDPIAHQSRLAQALTDVAGSFSIQFIAKVITSHLQTGGHTVILTTDDRDASRLVDALSIFVDAKDRALCSKNLSCQFYPELVVQAVCVPSSVGISEEELIQSPYPISLVDLTTPGPNHEIFQPKSFSKFFETRLAYYKGYLSALSNSAAQLPQATEVKFSAPLSTPGGSGGPTGSMPLAQTGGSSTSSGGGTPLSMGPSSSASSLPSQTPGTPLTPTGAPLSLSSSAVPNSPIPPQPIEQLTQSAPILLTPKSSNPGSPVLPPNHHSFMVPVTAAAPLVNDLLYQTLRLEDPLKVPFARHYCKLLACKASTLIKLIHSDIESRPVAESSDKWLKECLGLYEEADVNVLLAFAQKMDPEISSMMENYRLTLEEKYIEMFDGFIQIPFGKITNK